MIVKSSTYTVAQLKTHEGMQALLREVVPDLPPLSPEAIKAMQECAKNEAAWFASYPPSNPGTDAVPS